MQLPKKNKLKIFFIIILFLFFLTVGCFSLNKIPNLNQDEMSFALGANNFSNAGYDLCDNKFPLFPCNLKDWPYRGQTVSYYLNALFYRFYQPIDIFDIRILSVLIGALTGIFSLIFFEKLLQNVKNGFMYAAVLSAAFYFSPAFFTVQRFGAPYFILSILLQVVLFFLIYKFHKTNEKILLLFIPLVAALLMLDYQLYRFFAPFYLLLFILIFRQEIIARPDPQKNNLGALAKIKIILSKNKPDPAAELRGIRAGILQDVSAPPILSNSPYIPDASIGVLRRRNKYFIAGISIFTTIFLIVLGQIINDKFTTEYYFVKKSFSLIELLIDFLFHFSPIPFYSYYNLNYFFYPNNYGLFPALSVIFFIFGLAWIVKNFRQNNFLKFLLISFLAYPIPSAMLGTEKFASNRIINLIPIYFIISAYGIYTFQIFADYFKKNTPNNKIMLLVLSPLFWLILIVGQNFYFIYDYFYKIPYQTNSCQFTDKNGQNCNFTGLFDYLKKEAKNYDKIYLDKDLLFVESYAVFFNRIMHYDINNYEITDMTFRNDFTKNSLVVTSKIISDKLNLEKNYKLIKKIDEPNREEKFFYIFLVEN